MAKNTATRKRVVQNSAKTGKVTHKQARAAARKVAKNRPSNGSQPKASK